MNNQKIPWYVPKMGKDVQLHTDINGVYIYQF